MQIITTALPDIKILQPTVYTDARGYFYEFYQDKRYLELANLHLTFVQDNVSHSKKGTLRGLHFQRSHPQGKLVSVLSGEIYDVAVDVRPNSPTFGKWVGVKLTSENHMQLWIPPGFAHGFCVVSESADVFYKCTDYYFPEYEVSLRWDEPTVGVNWPLDDQPHLSKKDAEGISLASICDLLGSTSEMHE